jgi:hypothetical protein
LEQEQVNAFQPGVPIDGRPRSARLGTPAVQPIVGDDPIENIAAVNATPRYSP